MIIFFILALFALYTFFFIIMENMSFLMSMTIPLILIIGSAVFVITNIETAITAVSALIGLVALTNVKHVRS